MDRELMIRVMEEGDILEVAGSPLAEFVGPNELIMELNGRLFIVNFKEVPK